MKHQYYLGTTSPEGFVTQFSNTIKDDTFYTYILKGGPGTGKSTLMKKIASNYPEESEIYYCSSDTSSLDAVVLTDKKIIVVDGTAPHTFDPYYPGVCQEIINMSAYWDKSKLQNSKTTIKYLQNENLSCHTKVTRYIKALASVNTDIYKTGESAILEDKLEKYIKRKSEKLFGKIRNNTEIFKKYRQLSAFTSDGYNTCKLPEDYEIYLIKDSMFTAGSLLLKKLSDIASSNGIECIVSKCYGFYEPIYEHVIIPKLKIAFVSSNFFTQCNFEYENIKKINLTDFYDKEYLLKKKNTISFNKKVSLEILSEISKTIDTALCIHDELEKYYIGSLDIDRLNNFTDKFISSL